MHTRKDYLDKKCSHEEYYSQFINDSIKQLVINQIGLENILNSKEKSFNDIPLKKWDDLTNLTKQLIPLQIWKQAENPSFESNKTTFFWSLSSNVCILKEAARQIKADLEQNQNPKTQKIKP